MNIYNHSNNSFDCCDKFKNDKSFIYNDTGTYLNTRVCSPQLEKLANGISYFNEKQFDLLLKKLNLSFKKTIINNKICAAVFENNKLKYIFQNDKYLTINKFVKTRCLQTMIKSFIIFFSDSDKYYMETMMKNGYKTLYPFFITETKLRIILREVSREIDLEEDEDENETLSLEEINNKTCPRCNSKMVVKNGTFGYFLSCSKYPNCKKTLPIKNKKYKQILALREELIKERDDNYEFEF